MKSDKLNELNKKKQDFIRAKEKCESEASKNPEATEWKLKAEEYQQAIEKVEKLIQDEIAKLSATPKVAKRNKGNDYYDRIVEFCCDAKRQIDIKQKFNLPYTTITGTMKRLVKQNRVKKLDNKQFEAIK